MSTQQPKPRPADAIAKQLFGRDPVACKASGICVTCGGDASSFKDELSAREFQISGMCQTCQDGVFDVEHDD